MSAVLASHSRHDKVLILPVGKDNVDEYDNQSGSERKEQRPRGLHSLFHRELCSDWSRLGGSSVHAETWRFDATMSGLGAVSHCLTGRYSRLLCEC